MFDDPDRLAPVAVAVAVAVPFPFPALALTTSTSATEAASSASAITRFIYASFFEPLQDRSQRPPPWIAACVPPQSGWNLTFWGSQTTLSPSRDHESRIARRDSAPDVDPDPLRDPGDGPGDRAGALAALDTKLPLWTKSARFSLAWGAPNSRIAAIA